MTLKSATPQIVPLKGSNTALLPLKKVTLNINQICDLNLHKSVTSWICSRLIGSYNPTMAYLLSVAIKETKVFGDYAVIFHKAVFICYIFLSMA